MPALPGSEQPVPSGPGRRNCWWLWPKTTMPVVHAGQQPLPRRPAAAARSSRRPRAASRARRGRRRARPAAAGHRASRPPRQAGGRLKTRVRLHHLRPVERPARAASARRCRGSRSRLGSCLRDGRASRAATGSACRSRRPEASGRPLVVCPPEHRARARECCRGCRKSSPSIARVSVPRMRSARARVGRPGGSSVVCVHGVSAHWPALPQAGGGALSRRSFHVLAPDLRGYGLLGVGAAVEPRDPSG